MGNYVSVQEKILNISINIGVRVKIQLSAET